MENNDWEDFKSLDDYRSWVESKGTQFTFKVGVFGDNRHFYFNQLGFFFRDFIPDPSARGESAKSSILGEHHYHCINLASQHLFEKPKEFVRQGDVFIHADSFPMTSNAPSHWIVTSQTCTVENDLFCTIAPVYEENCLLKHLSALQLKLPMSAIRQNKKPRLVWFPPSEYLSDYDDISLVLDLSQSYTVKSVFIKDLKPVMSLTFPGNAYLCCRLAMHQFRDVENWDDGRSVKSVGDK